MHEVVGTVGAKAGGLQTYQPIDSARITPTMVEVSVVVAATILARDAEVSEITSLVVAGTVVGTAGVAVDTEEVQVGATLPDMVASMVVAEQVPHRDNSP